MRIFNTDIHSSIVLLSTPISLEISYALYSCAVLAATDVINFTNFASSFIL